MTPSDRRAVVLQRVASYICKDRQKNYGDAEDNFATIAQFWNVWGERRGLLKAGQSFTRLDVCEMMSLVKTARKVANLHYQDNWDDAVGYQAIGAAIAAEERNELPTVTNDEEPSQTKR